MDMLDTEPPLPNIERAAGPFPGIRDWFRTTVRSTTGKQEIREEGLPINVQNTLRLFRLEKKSGQKTWTLNTCFEVKQEGATHYEMRGELKYDERGKLVPMDVIVHCKIGEKVKIEEKFPSQDHIGMTPTHMLAHGRRSGLTTTYEHLPEASHVLPLIREKLRVLAIPAGSRADAVLAGRPLSAAIPLISIIPTTLQRAQRKFDDSKLETCEWIEGEIEMSPPIFIERTSDGIPFRSDAAYFKVSNKTDKVDIVFLNQEPMKRGQADSSIGVGDPPAILVQRTYSDGEEEDLQ